MFWVTGFLGLALGLAPFVLGFANHGSAVDKPRPGVMVVVVSLIGLASKPLDGRWEYWVLGLAAFIAPFIFGYASHTQPLWSGLFMGAALMLASLWAFQALREMSSHH